MSRNLDVGTPTWHAPPSPSAPRLPLPSDRHGGRPIGLDAVPQIFALAPEPHTWAEPDLRPPLLDRLAVSAGVLAIFGAAVAVLAVPIGDASLAAADMLGSDGPLAVVADALRSAARFLHQQ